MTGLKQRDLTKSKATDFSFLAKLAELEELGISRTGPADFAPLAG